MESTNYNFSNLPTEIKINILLNLEEIDIYRYCQSNKQSFDICNNVYIWSELAKKNFGYLMGEFLRNEHLEISPLKKYLLIKRLNSDPDWVRLLKIMTPKAYNYFLMENVPLIKRKYVLSKPEEIKKLILLKWILLKKDNNI